MHMTSPNPISNTRIAIFMEPIRFVFKIFRFFYFHTFLVVEFQKQSEEKDVLLDFYYPDGMGSVKHTLDDLEDIKSVSELKYNKNPSLKLNTESKETVIKPENK